MSKLRVHLYQLNTMNEFAGKDGDADALPPGRMDPERIAALIDGRVGDDERKSILEALAASEADTEVAMDAAAAMQSIGVSSNDVQLDSARRMRGRRSAPWLRAGLGLAAAAAIVITIRPWMPGVGDNSRERDGPQSFARALSGSSSLPAAWDYYPWSGRRGGDATPPDSALYVRLGARVTDLEVATRANDPMAVRLAAEISSLLEGVPGGSVAGVFYRRVSEVGMTDDGEIAASAGTALRGLPNQELIELGAWVEAARIAAARQDIEWFRARSNQRRLDALIRLSGNSPAVGLAAREIREELLRAPPEWREVGERLTSLLASW